MVVGTDDNFAFLTLLPEDIQPSIVGDYDFIAAPSSEQLTDPIAMQENFFMANPFKLVLVKPYKTNLITQSSLVKSQSELLCCRDRLASCRVMLSFYHRVSASQQRFVNIFWVPFWQLGRGACRFGSYER
jgi:hypothetical protein